MGAVQGRPAKEIQNAFACALDIKVSNICTYAVMRGARSLFSFLRLPRVHGRAGHRRPQCVWDSHGAGEVLKGQQCDSANYCVIVAGADC